MDRCERMMYFQFSNTDSITRIGTHKHTHLSQTCVHAPDKGVGGALCLNLILKLSEGIIILRQDRAGALFFSPTQKAHSHVRFRPHTKTMHKYTEAPQASVDWTR